MKVFEFTLVYENANGEKIHRYTYAENEDVAVANFYFSAYSKGAKLISCTQTNLSP